MRAIIVDDEPDGIRTLQKMLELNCPEVEIEATCTNAMDRYNGSWILFRQFL